MTKEEYRKVGIFGVITIAIIAIAFAAIGALRNNSGISACSYIISPSERYNCIESFAIKTYNSITCSSLPNGFQQGCINQVALSSDNYTKCYASQNASIEYSCISNFSTEKQNPTFCAYDKNSSAESTCIFSLATSGYVNSTSYCKNIGNASERLSCDYITYYKEAVEYNNTSYCGLLPNSTSAPGALGISIIMNISNTSASYGLAYPFLYSLPDREICYDSISHNSTSNSTSSCVYNENSTNSTACQLGSLSGVIANDSVYYNITKLCESAQNASMPICSVSSLISDAYKTKSPSTCLQANQTGYANLCLTSLALRYNNTQDCNYISNASLKNVCINDLTK